LKEDNDHHRQAALTYNNDKSSRSRRLHVVDNPTLRLSQASTVPMGSSSRRVVLSSNQDAMIQQQQQQQQECSWEEESPYSYGQYYIDDPSSAQEYQESYHCGRRSGTTTVTSSSSSSSSSNSIAPSVNTTKTSRTNSSGVTSLGEHEERIRQGIIDVSKVVATYIAGFLAFVVGIFLGLLSPFVKVIKLIVGDLKGLLGDAAFLQEVGSLWRMYRELRRGGERSSSGHHDGGGEYRYYDDDSTNEGYDGTVFTDNSSQYVGGWKPSVSSAGSRGSKSTGTGNGSWIAATSSSRRSNNSTSSRGKGSGGGPIASMSAASRSYSSLPYVYEDKYAQDEGTVCSQVSSSSSPGKRGLSSRSRPNRIYQERRQRGGDPCGNYYNDRGGHHPTSSRDQQQRRSSSQQLQQHSRHDALPSPSIPSQQYDPSYSSRTTVNNNPQKRHQHGGILPSPSRSSSCVV